MRPIDITAIKNYYQLVDGSTQESAGTNQFTVNPEAVQSIMRLFAKDAVYDRQGSEPFMDKYAIHEFFSRQRPLVGKHVINDGDIAVTAGIDGGIANAFQQRFPGVDPARCNTITTKGIFIGKHYVTGNSEGGGQDRPISSMSDVRLGFQDYWVVCEGQVLYRNSKIQALHKARAGAERY